PVILNGAAAVSGGQLPYNFSWDMGLPSISTPTVSPSVNTVYTLIVTDAVGCQQLAQVVVSVYMANAGPNKSSCAGQPVRIGTAPLPASNISYSWIPAAGLNSNNIAQPMANPLAVTDYQLTVTLQKADGSNCIMQDSVRVTPVAPPVDPNFAGPDKVACYQELTSIGTLPEAGFSYSWLPSVYLTRVDSAQTYFDTKGNEGQLPVPNPTVLHAYASKQGCVFSDTVIVSTIEANAGQALCGEGIIGMPDRTPYIQETYAWTLTSGPGNFLGPTDLPQVPVSASTPAASVYALAVTYNGKTCNSSAMVKNSCIGNCSVRKIPADDCDGYTANGGQVTLIGSSDIPDALYSWWPQVGLSAYTGNVVQLTDTVSRTYIMTAASPHHSWLTCSASITTNLMLESPSFPARDTVTCADVPVTIGAAPQAGYSYQWTGSGLSANNISNPVATVSQTSSFYVTVTGSNGCARTDTIVVTVPNQPANAGADKIVCDNAIVTLGTDSVANTTYSWDPPAAPWQNGTNQFSAKPQVLSAVTVTYTLTTNMGGCTSTDDVTITVNNVPTIPNAPDKQICAGSVAVIGSEPIPDVTYQWSPATGLEDPTSSTTIANPASSTTYTLTATEAHGCTVSDTVRVLVSFLLKVPNVFTPNGDGVNDLWAIRFLDTYADLKLEVFNRWGQLVYRWQDGHRPWD
ncbi:MAG: gliding motility-associated C-terminal domain-containing protein, partial [Sphingobacteriales bacterium]